MSGDDGERGPVPTWFADVPVVSGVNVCPRRQCRGRTRHSRLVHWLGWALR